MAIAEDEGERVLRVLAADEDTAALESTARLLRGLGHEVVACAVSLSESARAIADEDPDVAVVVLHEDAEQHALDLIEEIAEFASGPVIALLSGENPGFVREAADRGIYAYARGAQPEALQGAIDIALRRYEETVALAEQVDQLEGAMERRSVIERAKGILMERHGVGERAAFEQLRAHARASRRRVVDVARAVTERRALPVRDGD